jgi:hypothetical protein
MHARRFVQRLIINTLEVAIYIDGCVVYVIDGGFHMQRVVELARSSSASAIQALSLSYPSKATT